VDETRFKTLDDFNDPDVTLVTLDGEMSQIAAAEQFPKAKTLSFQGLSTAAERFEAVAVGKADAVPFDAPVGAEYMANNPGKLKAFPVPVRVGDSAIVVPHGEPDLKAMLDTTIGTMLATGAMERIVKKNEKHPGTYLLPAQGYRTE
jgi:polar amino acid transport system substrate-binding protein